MALTMYTNLSLSTRPQPQYVQGLGQGGPGISRSFQVQVVLCKWILPDNIIEPRNNAFSLA